MVDDMQGPSQNPYDSEPAAPQSGPTMLTPKYDAPELLRKFDELKRESLEYRWVWEREWLRDIFYVMNRQWITFHPTRREWIDKRLQKWVPRPVTNKMSEVVQSIRTNMAAINLAAKARPAGKDTESIAAAEVADELEPLIREEHNMNLVMREADFWSIVTGNSCLQLSWDKDTRFNKQFIQHERCLTCDLILPPQSVISNMGMCPQCQGKAFMPAIDQTSKPIGEWVSFGRGKTSALSPFEYAFPSDVTRFDEIPYIIRLRWRDKHYYEANHPDMVRKIAWEKAPTDRSLQIYKSLAVTNDVGTGSHFAFLGASGSPAIEGITEYELWMKPTLEFPKGFVMRVAGDKSAVLVESQDEGIPGPIPYVDVEDNPLFPFVHAPYEHIGGRLYGRSALSPLIQKQDQLNQLDSLIQLIVQRMANPVWIIPENAGIENITGEPGLQIKWNVLAAQGQGKPERIAGQEIQSSLFAFRKQILDDIDSLSGAFDIMKGQKPTGVEAFSALQLLVERSQSRFTSAYQARGEMYRKWFSVAIELERKFGPDQRTKIIMGQNRGYTFRHFQNAQLQGQITIQIEDGSTVPKTALGKRAAVEQANQLRLLNPDDPDQKYALLTMFGLPDLAPSLDFHIQTALQLQDDFEKWSEEPQGPSPLVVKPWFDARIHYSERIKWLNTDRMKEILAKSPQLEQLVTMNLNELQAILNPPPAPAILGGTPAQPQGGALAMANSNVNSTNTGIVPSGNSEGNQGQGPM